MGEQRKNYKKLLRAPYDFGVDTGKPSAEDNEAVIQNCECSDSDPGIDPNPGTCLVDEYTFCGSAGITEDADLDELPNYYLRVTPSPEPNPAVIFIPSFGEGGGCFTKGDQIACSAASGFLLGMDEYLVLPDTTADPACGRPPCVGGNCPLLRLTLCTNDPGYPDVTPFEIVLPISFFGGFGLGYKVVKYGGHCYETRTVPCLDEPYDGAVLPDFDEIEVISTGGCSNDDCTCCSNAMEILDSIRDGIKERLRATNSGDLPVVVDHDWSDPDYILNGDSVETACDGADCDDELTDCQDRYVIWKAWFEELYYWIDYLYGLGIWLNVDTYAGGSLEGETYTDPIDVFSTEFEESFNGTTDTRLDWFLNAFAGPNSANEIYTSGGVNNTGGLGFNGVIRFGDAFLHVVVNDGNATWCELVNLTADRMLEFLQKLNFIYVSVATQVDISSRQTDRLCGGADCAAAIACVQDEHGDVPYGIRRRFTDVCVGAGEIGASTANIGVRSDAVSSGGICVSAETIRGKISSDLTVYTNGTPVIYLALTYPTSLGFGFGLTFDGTRPTDGFQVWGAWTGGSLSVGAVSTSDYVTGSEADPSVYGDCADADDATHGWRVISQIVVIEGDFTV
jgi:hypothetical protein